MVASGVSPRVMTRADQELRNSYDDEGQFVSIADYVRNPSTQQQQARKARNSQFGTIDDARPAAHSNQKPGMQRNNSLNSLRLESKGLRSDNLLATIG